MAAMWTLLKIFLTIFLFSLIQCALSVQKNKQVTCVFNYIVLAFLPMKPEFYCIVDTSSTSQIDRHQDIFGSRFRYSETLIIQIDIQFFFFYFGLHVFMLESPVNKFQKGGTVLQPTTPGHAGYICRCNP